MSVFNELSVGEMDEAIASAILRKIPVTITLLQNGQWVNLYTRLVSVCPQRILLSMPVAEIGQQHEFQPAEKIGLSFKLKHHKYLFAATVGGISRGGDTEPQLAICKPSRMQRLQRRLYIRAQLPQGCLARASFWLGGCAQEPAGGAPEVPVWSGRVRNLSVGGMQIEVPGTGIASIEIGYTVGVRVMFGAGAETVFADAQVRHFAVENDRTIVGFQFAGLEQIADGRKTIGVLTRKVTEYQRLAPRETRPPVSIGQSAD